MIPNAILENSPAPIVIDTLQGGTVIVTIPGGNTDDTLPPSGDDTISPGDNPDDTVPTEPIDEDEIDRYEVPEITGISSSDGTSLTTKAITITGNSNNAIDELDEDTQTVYNKVLEIVDDKASFNALLMNSDLDSEVYTELEADDIDDIKVASVFNVDVSSKVQSVIDKGNTVTLTLDIDGIEKNQDVIALTNVNNDAFTWTTQNAIAVDDNTVTVEFDHFCIVIILVNKNAQEQIVTIPGGNTDDTIPSDTVPSGDDTPTGSGGNDTIMPSVTFYSEYDYGKYNSMVFSGRDNSSIVTIPSGTDTVTTPSGEDTVTPGGNTDDTVTIPSGEDTVPSIIIYSEYDKGMYDSMIFSGSKGSATVPSDTTPSGEDTIPPDITIPGGDDTITSPGGNTDDTVPSDTTTGGNTDDTVTIPSGEDDTLDIPDTPITVEGMGYNAEMYDYMIFDSNRVNDNITDELINQEATLVGNDTDDTIDIPDTPIVNTGEGYETDKFSDNLMFDAKDTVNTSQYETTSGGNTDDTINPSEGDSSITVSSGDDSPTSGGSDSDITIGGEFNSVSYNDSFSYNLSRFGYLKDISIKLENEDTVKEDNKNYYDNVDNFLTRFENDGIQLGGYMKSWYTRQNVKIDDKVESKWVKVSRRLLSEIAVFGNRIHGKPERTEITSQFPIFKLAPNKVIMDQDYWLSDNVAGTNNVCIVTKEGESYFADSEETKGVRPFFIIG